MVGADGNALNRTTDGGRTWTWLATPVDELHPGEAREPELRPPESFQDSLRESEVRRPAENARRVEGVWCLGERLVVLQRRQLFQRPLAGDGTWSALDLTRRGVIAAVFDADRLLVVTDDLRFPGSRARSRSTPHATHPSSAAPPPWRAARAAPPS